MGHEMGYMSDGQWRTGQQERVAGSYERKPSAFRNWIAADGPYPPEPDRYHLYISLACPWASRTVMVRKLKKLEQVISMSEVHPDILEQGWTFEAHPDPIHRFAYLHQIYAKADPHFSGRVTVPVLWDRATSTIVNNESAEIIVMLNRQFEEWADRSVDLYPASEAEAIDQLNVSIYEKVNNAVYRAGFSRDAAVYHAAVWDIFNTFEELEERLSTRRYLFGDRMTLSDVRLFTTAVRFDLVYYSHFKCNVRHLWDFPNLMGWLRDVYQTPGVAETVDLQQIKRHYYASQLWINPTGIVPVGPTIDLRAPHRRDHLGD